MLAALAFVVLATADPALANVRISHDANWTSDKRPIVVTVGSLAPVTIALGAESAVLAVPATNEGTVVSVTVKLPGPEKPFTRRVVMVQGASYLIRGNPCARYEVVPQPAARLPGPVVRFDTSKIPAKRHPLRVLEGFFDKSDQESAVVQATLAKPGTSDPITPGLSAMCARSGASLVVVDAKRKVLIDEMVVLPEGRITTITLSTSGAWTATVGEAVPE